jgi:recombination DNA repair RAD52 pathway protein
MLLIKDIGSGMAENMRSKAGAFEKVSLDK